jgi:hypothetical protein
MNGSDAVSDLIAIGRGLQFAVSPAETLIPADIREKYEVIEVRHAAAILVHDLHEEWSDIRDVLANFVLRKTDIVAPGGGKTRISDHFDKELGSRGWRERKFGIEYVVDGETRQSDTHKVDCFKGRVGLEVEWNSKDQTFVRDLNNFRLLFDLAVISVGVIVTRCDELQQLFDSLGFDEKGNRIGAKYGASTTHMSKLRPRLATGGGGGCPIMVFGIRKALYDPSR